MRISMKTLVVIISILVISTQLYAEQILLAKGQTKSLHASGGSVFNSDSKVVKVRPNGTALLVVGKAEGLAQIVVGKKTFEVAVVKQKTLESFEMLKKRLQDNIGLSIRVARGRVTIQGELLRFEDWKRLSSSAKENDLEYSFQAKVDPQIQAKLNELLFDLFKVHLLPSPNISLQPEAIALVSKEQKESLNLYKEILEPFGFRVLINENSLSIEPTIGVKILVTEMRKKHFQRLGIKWPSSYQAQVIPSFAPAIASMSIEALEENGFAKILASPHLICRSGKEAHFLAGGEIPIKIITQHTADVIWKKYGILLNVKPKADRSGHMSIQITTEVSTIDPSQTIDGIPGFLTNRIDTHFDLSGTGTIVLSGMLKNETGESKEGLPFLTRIPVLGALFSSQEYRDHQTELVIMVTPKVLTETELSKGASSEL